MRKNISPAYRAEPDEEIVALRRQLHALPEVSGQERQTAALVAQTLARFGPTEIRTGLGGTGVAAVFDSGLLGPVLLFRAELDALPIGEVNVFAHRSAVEGVSHKCGHDGHMAILLGLAKWMQAHPLPKGRVILLFQPAEETGAGAEAVLADPRFSKLAPDWSFALHNLPGFPLHQIIVREGAFTAAVKSIIIRLHGKTSHAAEPERGINPAPAIAALIIRTEQQAVKDLNRRDFALLTPVFSTLGERAYGVSAGYGELHLTLRTWTEARMQEVVEALLALIDEISGKYQLKTDIAWTDVFRANMNDGAAVQLIRQSATTQGLAVREIDAPLKWGEDFGLFTQQFRGAMFGLGAGEQPPALHHPDYDFPDELISTGIRVFGGIIQNLLFNEGVVLNH